MLLGIDFSYNLHIFVRNNVRPKQLVSAIFMMVCLSVSTQCSMVDSTHLGVNNSTLNHHNTTLLYTTLHHHKTTLQSITITDCSTSLEEPSSYFTPVYYPVTCGGSIPGWGSAGGTDSMVYQTVVIHWKCFIQYSHISLCVRIAVQCFANMSNLVKCQVSSDPN